MCVEMVGVGVRASSVLWGARRGPCMGNWAWREARAAPLSCSAWHAFLFIRRRACEDRSVNPQLHCAECTVARVSRLAVTSAHRWDRTQESVRVESLNEHVSKGTVEPG